MAKATGQVTKIYSLQTIGYPELVKQLDTVTVKFENIKKAKLSAQGKVSLAKDITEAGKYSDELAKLVIQEQELRVEQQRLTNDLKAMNLQRQIDINTQRQKIISNQAEAGSIALIRKEANELRAALILKNQKGDSTLTFRGEVLTIQQATAKLKELTAAEQEFRRQFAADQTLVGEYTTGIVNAFKQMGLDDLVGGQITRTQDTLNLLNKDFDKLQEELKQTKAAGQSTETIEKQMIENRNEVIKLDTELARLRNDLRGTGDVGNQITTSVSNGFRALKGQVGQFALQFIGLQTLFSKISAGIENTRLISDQQTDLEIQLNNDANAADRLLESLKALDTRTGVAGLQEIADTALKAGVASKNILEVTKAIDQTKIAFGKDFGSIEEGTETFAKLISIFFEDREVTGDRILGIGNAIRSLANETVASVPFLNDFSGRMAGLRQISKITLPDVLGLGAGFEQFKQSAEVSSTVLIKLIPQMAANIEKFAKIAELSDVAFKKLLTDNPAEALLKVSEGFVKGNGDIEEFAKTLEESGIQAGRAISIIGTLGGKADVFRQRIKRAGETINETGAITDAFNKKNTNLAATMDKITKRFADVAANRGFQLTIAGIATAVTVLLGNLPALLTLVGLLGVAWGVQNAQLLILRAQMIGYNLLLGASYVAMGLLTVATGAYNAIMFVFTGAVTLATRALAFFGVTAKAAAGPLGIILTIAGVLAAAFAAFGRTLSSSVGKVQESIAAQRAYIDVANKAAETIANESGELNKWIRVATNANVSLESRKIAIENLIKQFPEYFGNLKAETASVADLTKAYDLATIAIRKKAFAQASADLAADAQRKVNEVAALELRLDVAFASGKGLIRTIEGVTDAEEKLLDSGKKLVSVGASSIGVFNAKDFQEIKATLARVRESREQTTDAFDKMAQDFNDRLKSAPATTNADGSANLAGRTIEAIKADLEKANKDFNTAVIGSADYKALKAKIAKLEDELERADPKKEAKTPRASRLTAAQKDKFKDIEADRDEEVANEKIKFQTRLEDEETYLKNVLIINQKAIDKKLKILSTGTAEERKQISALQLERITSEQETNNKIFELRQQALKIQLDDQIKTIQEQNRIIQQNPVLSEEAKAQAQLDADNSILNLQIKFNSDIDSLEKQLNQQSLTNAKEGNDAVRKTKQQVLDDQKAVTEAQLQDIRIAGGKQRTEIELEFNKLRKAILDNDKLTADQRKKALEKLAKLQNVTILSSELEQLTKEFEKIRIQYVRGLANEQAYLDAKNKMEKKQEEVVTGNEQLAKERIALPSGSNTQDLLRQRLSKLFGFTEDGEEDQLLGAVISQGFNLATDAMNSYFDAEAQRINESLQINLQRIDMEKEQVLAKAQSQAEIASIEKQYAAKKRAEEVKAGEQLKKLRRSEAKIALAAELANIWASVWTLGPIAGPIAGLVFSGLALGRYALRVGEINREKFERGGKPDDVPGRGGKFRGKRHSDGGTPFKFKGTEYEAEVDELAVIRTKNAPKNKKVTVSGTQMQIASAINKMGGGVDFKPGATMKKFAFGGSLGQTLQAPVFQPSNITTFMNNNSAMEKKMDELITSINDHKEETAKRIDRIEVVQVTGTVTSAQRKEVKQKAIGSF